MELEILCDWIAEAQLAGDYARADSLSTVLSYLLAVG